MSELGIPYIFDTSRLLEYKCIKIYFKIRENSTRKNQGRVEWRVFCDLSFIFGSDTVCIRLNLFFF